MTQTVLMRSEALSPLMRRPFVVSSPLLVSHLRRLSFQSRFRNCPPVWRLGPTISLRRRSICVRATDVSQPGSIDSPMINSMQIKQFPSNLDHLEFWMIKEQLNADTVIVQDANGDGRHVSIYVVSSAFEGQSSVNRQRMVYKAIREELESTVHAVDQMLTQTPAEAA